MAYSRNSVSNEEKLKQITERLEKGIQDMFTSEKFMEYLKVMSKFHNYSLNNSLLIAFQRPDATYVAGFKAWQQKFDRKVNSGEHGIQILAPVITKKEQEVDKLDPITGKPVVDENGEPIKEKKEVSVTGYRTAYVFDISQTNGKALPEISTELKGNVEEYNKFFEALKRISPVPIEFEQIARAKGYFDRVSRRIAINEGMSQQQNVKTAIHELAHAQLHDYDIKNVEPEEQKDRRTKEVEAESVAYTICQHYGIDTSQYSFGYVASWSSGQEMPELKASLKTIRDTAAELINKIDRQLEELERERQQTELKHQEELQQQQIREEEQKEIDRREHQTEAIVATVIVEPLVYMKSAQYARENGETEAWKASFKLNIECIGYIADHAEKAQQTGTLSSFSNDLADKYGVERSMYVIARNVQAGNNYSMDVRDRAAQFEYPDKDTPYDSSVNYIKDINQAVLNQLFVELMEKERQRDIMPDQTTIEQMHDYGYTYDGMLPMEKQTALELYDDDVAIFMLHADNTESMVLDREEIEAFDGYFGVEKEDWIAHISVQAEIYEYEHGAQAMEASFLAGTNDGYAIYQLSDTADKNLMFSNISRIGGADKVDKANYKVTYTDTIDIGDADIYGVLNNIFEQFNISRPEDFKGHSLSVSDIVAVRQNGELTAFYVDSFAFEEIPQFFDPAIDIQKDVTDKKDTQKGHEADILYERARAEQDAYVGDLKTLPPEKIIEKAYEKVVRDDILEAFKKDITPGDARELLKLDTPLSECYAAWLQSDYSHMDMLRDEVYSFAKKLSKQNAEQSEYDGKPSMNDIPKGHEADILYERARAEQDAYVGDLKTLPPEKIIEKAYEKVVRDDILEAFKKDITPGTAKELLKLDTPLSKCYDAWSQADHSHMNMLKDTVYSFTKKLSQQRFEQQTDRRTSRSEHKRASVRQKLETNKNKVSKRTERPESRRKDRHIPIGSDSNR